jgi:predicted RNA-binding Zn ribbon-like protein
MMAVTIRRERVTGQVDFDSHVNATVLRAVALVNAVTPGMQGGRSLVAPTGAALAAAINGAIGELLDEAESARLATWAGRLREVVTLLEAGEPDAACAACNAVLQETGAVPVLARHDDEPWHLHFHALDAAPAEGWAAPMATGLAMVLGSSSIDRLGVCTAPACDRVYADTSRNGTRRFCSTACQNRVKAAAFRARRAAAEA